MKIAVASENQVVSGHFGHCQNFNVFEVANKEILSHESIASPGHKPGFLPNFLHDMGVSVVISGNMGSGAMEGLKKKGITPITGAHGDAEAAVKKYLAGNLTSAKATCHGHGHGHEHGHEHACQCGK